MLRAVRGGIHPLDSRDSRTGCRPDPLAMCSDIPSYPMNFMVPAIAQRCCTAGLAPGRAPGCHVWTHMSHVCYRYNNACLHSYRSEYLCTHRHTHTDIYIYTHIYIYIMYDHLVSDDACIRTCIDTFPWGAFCVSPGACFIITVGSRPPRNRQNLWRAPIHPCVMGEKHNDSALNGVILNCLETRFKIQCCQNHVFLSFFTGDVLLGDA